MYYAKIDNRIYCEVAENSDLPFFLTPAWLDRVAPGHWLPCVVFLEGSPFLLLPLVTDSLMPMFQVIHKPAFTPYLPLYSINRGTLTKGAMSHIEQIAKALAKLFGTALRMDFVIENNPNLGVVFSRQGWYVSMRYQHELRLDIGLETLRANFSKTVRKQIKVAEKKQWRFVTDLPLNSQLMQDVRYLNVQQKNTLINLSLLSNVIVGSVLEGATVVGQIFLLLDANLQTCFSLYLEGRGEMC